ncbi:MAG TPA: UDP-glucose 4-epimerase GalE [Planctomycetota bacterium]|nr:UDP-glucose 4-epimerase GalE [Planctomycetota bacterium]
MSTILVTGGAGYIGSHAVLELIAAGHRPIVLDNLSNSSAEALKRVERIAGTPVAFHQVDLLDRAGIDRVFAAQPIDSVIHFAGLKAVGESTQQPLRYYHNNITGTLHLLDVMRERNVRKLVFSSSATVYGDPERVPIPETARLQATNPYGNTKLFIEEICRDLAKADAQWRIVLLRYFNPVGAHPSGLIGEDPVGIPNNLMPFIMQVAVGKRPHLNIFGNDWPTPDGTGVRDYIHVVDLARGHLAALDHLPRVQGCVAYNLGTGRGCSVLELLKAVSATVGRELPYRFAPRRPGDVATCYADPTAATRDLGWRAELGLDRMCADSWRWQSGNPEGYRTATGV